MSITNLYSLPEALVRAVANDGYQRGDAWRTVTELVGPARLAALRHKHASEIVEDVSERIWSLLGQAVHVVLERSGDDALKEQRLWCEVDGVRISGQYDHFSMLDGVLTDFKVSSAWTVVRGAKPEWSAQLNLLAWLLREHWYDVNALQIVLIARDWRRSEMLRGARSGYPLRSVATIDVPMWTLEEVRSYLAARIALHREAETALQTDGPIPFCTPEERWQRDTTWAVKKEGRKTAVRVYDSEDEAVAHVGDDPKLSVEKRPGVAIRCAEYCPVRSWCTAREDGQFQPGDLPTETGDDDGAADTRAA